MTLGNKLAPRMGERRAAFVQAWIIVKAGGLEVAVRGVSFGNRQEALRRLADASFVRNKYNLMLSGPTGVGKTYIANALGRALCAQGTAAAYTRLPELFLKLSGAQMENRYAAYGDIASGKIFKMFHGLMGKVILPPAPARRVIPSPCFLLR
jgi:hypothetical protein